MSVREYIGARYVPLFMGQWDDTVTYEPLSIVMHEGNSYTSRQFVPVGIDIDNDTFWAETGNYNAQIEQYREEVLAFDERIETNKANIGISFVGNYGAKEKDVTVNWQSIVNQIAEVSNTIDFGNGQWYMNNEITIPENIKRISGNGCILYVQDTVDTLFYIPGKSWDTFDRFFSITGITVNGNSKVEKIFEFELGNNANIYNCSFNNFNDTAIYNSYHGCFITNCLFFQKGQVKGCGIRTTTDNFIANCKFFNMQDAIKCGSNTQIMGCYFFSQFFTEYWRAISSYTGTVWRVLTVTNCEFDCVPIVFENFRDVNCQNNSFFWNGKDDTLNQPHYIFNATNNNAGIMHCIFSNNIIDMSDTNPISNIIYTFNDKILRVDNYTSENNIVKFYFSDPQAAHFALFIGFQENLGLPISSDVTGKYTKIQPNGNQNVTIQPTFKLDIQPNSLELYRWHSTISYIKKAPGILDTTDTNRTFKYKSGVIDDMYLEGWYCQIAKIVVAGGTPYNMPWTMVDSVPSDFTDAEVQHIALQ